VSWLAVVLASNVPLCIGCDRTPHPGVTPHDADDGAQGSRVNDGGMAGIRAAEVADSSTAYRDRCRGPSDYKPLDATASPPYHPAEWMRYEVGNAYSVWLPASANSGRTGDIDWLDWVDGLGNYLAVACSSDVDAGAIQVTNFITSRASTRGPRPMGPPTSEAHTEPRVIRYGNDVEVRQWSAICARATCDAITVASGDYGRHESEYFIEAITGLP